MRRILATTAAALLAIAAAPVVDVTAPEECEQVPELGPRACATAEAAGYVLAGVCDHVPVAPAESCGTARGLTVDPGLVDAYTGSDLAALHRLQRELGTALPLRSAQLLSSHNSYNAQAYLPTVSNQDPNQWYSLSAQLDMEVRQLELDVHTWFGADDDGRLPVLCHGTGPQVGCSVDRPLADGLAEIRAWLDAHPDEVIMIDVEDHLDGEAGHDEGAAVVTEHLGELLYVSDTDQPCPPLPLDVSFDDVRASGAQVLLVSSCGSGVAWPGIVHGYGDWHQGRLGAFDTATCGPDYDRGTYDGAWTRYWEDTTWLSAMAGGVGPRLEGDTLRAAMECGLSLASLDRLHPDDERLEILLWSWALDERPHEAALGAEAVIAADGRFRVRDDARAGATLGALCRAGDGAFSVVSVPDDSTASTTAGLAALDEACGPGAVLSTPRSAREMTLARAAISASGVTGVDVLLDLAVTSAGEGGTGWRAR